MFTGHVVEGLDPVAARDEWLARRREHVGGSDVAGILGIGPWSSPWSVWGDKCGLLPEDPESEVMEAGRWLESAIGPWFTHRTGLHVTGEQLVIEAADDPLAWCTADGFVTDGPNSVLDDALGGLQIKTAGFGKAWETIPAHYQAQEQWAMHVHGLDRVWFAVLMGRRLDIHELERDDSDIAFIVDRVHCFWDDHVVTGTPPPTDGHDATARAIGAVYPTHTPDLSVELDDLVDVLEQWERAKSARSIAEKTEKECKAAICAALGDAEEGTVDGQRAVTYREQTRKSYVVNEATFRVLRRASKSKEAAA